MSKEQYTTADIQALINERLSDINHETNLSSITSAVASINEELRQDVNTVKSLFIPVKSEDEVRATIAKTLKKK